MRIVTEFPRKIRMQDDVVIPLKDGTKLAARIWLPVDAERDPVPAILEYLPYRRRDGTAERDAMTHPYFAGHGYACVRVDIRGTGDSEGVLLGEYLKQEQDDALEIINWITRQPWCSGAVGMIGISWGGFNGLQVAARRPPALKAIVTIASTDDRYADDIHFMGGCLLGDKLSWGSTIFSINAAPPDPEIVGDRWRDMWLQRLEGDGLYFIDWMKHQRRDAFYKHGSVCEDWNAIQCAVYAVGGWADGYSNTIFRLLKNLKCPRKGLVGPWAHRYPHFGLPGPEIGFLQECLRWWDHWLKGKKTGIMDEPMLRAWMEDPIAPSPSYAEKPGHWVAETSWPSTRIKPQVWSLTPGHLAEGEQAKGEVLKIRSPQATGLASGNWCPYGIGNDMALDQRMEAGGSLVFDSAPLTQDLELLGAPVVNLEIAADKPNALVACTLSEIMPDGAVARISYGVLNLTHRESHEKPTPLEPGRFYSVGIQLNELGHRFAAGNKLRLAISSSYWITVWPSPEPVTLSIRTGASRIGLPVRPKRAEDAALAPFPPSEGSTKLRKTILEEGAPHRTISTDVATGRTLYQRVDDTGLFRVDDIDLTIRIVRDHKSTILPDDPTSAKTVTHWKRSYGRGKWQVSAESWITLTSDRENFKVTATLDAFEGDRRIFSKNWDETIKRDLV
ncbi:MAG: CocE/NonD family hydrolase [Hypericibacter sp.]